MGQKSLKEFPKIEIFPIIQFTYKSGNSVYLLSRTLRSIPRKEIPFIELAKMLSHWKFLVEKWTAPLSLQIYVDKRSAKLQVLLYIFFCCPMACFLFNSELLQSYFRVTSKLKVICPTGRQNTEESNSGSLTILPLLPYCSGIKLVSLHSNFSSMYRGCWFKEFFVVITLMGKT